MTNGSKDSNAYFYIGLVIAIPTIIIFLVSFLASIRREENEILKKRKAKAEQKALDDSIAEQIRHDQEEIDASLKKQYVEFNAELEAIPRVDVLKSDFPAHKRKASDRPYVEFSRIDGRTSLNKIFPLVVVDVETTGLRASGHIIEVSAIKYQNDATPTCCFTSLCAPATGTIPMEATSINGITDEMVSDSPTFFDIAESFSQFINGCNIVGHNLDFDLKFLFVGGTVFSEKAKYYDTYQLAKSCLTVTKWNYKKSDYDYGDVEDYKLDTLCNHYYINRDNSHRSLSDCYATAKLLFKLIDEKTDIDLTYKGVNQNVNI